MRYLLRHFFIVFLFINLISCDVASELLTTNHFKEFEDVNPFSLVVNEESWKDLSDDEKREKIDKYTDAALSKDDSMDLFNSLGRLPGYRDEVIKYYQEHIVDVLPDSTLETYDADLRAFQRNSMALALIDIYTRNANAFLGFDQLTRDYYAGEEGVLTHDLFLNRVFMVEKFKNEGLSREEIVKDLKNDLQAAYRAGEVFNRLGKTIRDKDNPTAFSVNEKNGDTILLSCMLYRVVSLSEAPLFTGIDTISGELANNIYDGNFSSGKIKFPQNTGKPSDLSVLEHYLGIGGALTYTASGFKLPPVIDLGGTQK